jgi:predicted enzyme related to lactoylglutathione lyase
VEDVPVLPWESRRKGITMLTVTVKSIMVDDQDKALEFYTNVLGFDKKIDIDVGHGARWLTVVSPAAPDGVEVSLEPDWNPYIDINGEPAAIVFKRTLFEAGIPWTAFTSDDLQTEFERLKDKGVKFTMESTEMGPVSVAVLDDTCGNLIQLQQLNQ